MKKITSNSISYVLDYPDEFNSNYIHYNAIVPAITDDHAYYTFQTGRTLLKADFKTNKTIVKPLHDNDRYLRFDTANIRNVGYIAEYSFNTKYNLALFSTEDKLILVNYTPKYEDNSIQKEWFYSLDIYDTDLNFISSRKLEHGVFNTLVSFDGNKVYFIYTPEDKIYEYTINP